MPTRGTISYETHLALRNNMGGVAHAVLFAARQPIVQARNGLARAALDAAAAHGFNFTPREMFVLWADDDAWWIPETVPVMLKAMRELPKIDALFGKFGVRAPYGKIVALRDADDPESFPREGVDCENGEIVQIERAGFHFVLMRLSLLKRVGPDPFALLSDQGVGEDYVFCDRAIAAGATLAVGMGLPVFHLDPSDGTAYLPGMPAMIMDGNRICNMSTDHATADGRIKTAEKREYGGLAKMEELYAETDRIIAGRAIEIEQRRAVFASKGAAQ